MTVITQLTPEQEALTDTVREEWLNWLFSLAPLDREKATNGIEFMYRLANLKKPTVIEVDSPFACQVAASMLPHLRAAENVWADVWKQIREQVWDHVWEQVGNQVRDHVWEQVGKQVRGHVWDHVWDQVGKQVRDHVWEQVKSPMTYREPLWVSSIGWLDWAAWSDFYSRIGVATEIEKAERLRDYLRSGVWYCIPLKGVAIVCGPPLMCKRDSEHRLHCEDGPAMAWPDGWAMWRWHGFSVTEKFIMHPEQYTQREEEG